MMLSKMSSSALLLRQQQKCTTILRWGAAGPIISPVGVWASAGLVRTMEHQHQHQMQNSYSSSYPSSSRSSSRFGTSRHRIYPRQRVRHNNNISNYRSGNTVGDGGVPSSYKDMNESSLITLGGNGNYEARQEILKRHIMIIDQISYEKATDIFIKIEEKNYEWMNITAVPFQISIVIAGLGGLISIPLVFHLPTVEYFNEHFVTAEHPPLKELETSLEVGSWAWNWMEPVLGTSTFLLLCLQYMRMNLSHLGIQPYTHRMKEIRGRRLAEAFPQYSESLLVAYSESSPFYNPKKLWI